MVPPESSSRASVLGAGALAPGTLVGEYVIERVIGEGGMATVYAAVHPIIGKHAAIKVIKPSLYADPTTVERFVREARAVNEIGHPNIVDIFSIGRLGDGRSYFIMELLVGETLAARMDARRLTLAEVPRIARAVCDALIAAHRHGIIHRDIKPDNVFLAAERDGTETVKLLDFGIAKQLAKGTARLTLANLIMGTPEYLSPEQARADDVDDCTDVYSLGVMLYEMVLGRLPFVASTAVDFLILHMSETPPAPRLIWPEIPEPLEWLLVKMLEKEPDRRPTVAEVRRVLAQTPIAALTRSTRPTTPGPTAPALAAGLPTLTASGFRGELRPGASAKLRRPRASAWTAIGMSAAAGTLFWLSLQLQPGSPRPSAWVARLLGHGGSVGKPALARSARSEKARHSPAAAEAAAAAPGRRPYNVTLTLAKDEANEVWVAPLPVSLEPHKSSTTRPPSDPDGVLDPFATAH